MAFVARPGRIDLCIPVVLDVEGERITVETRNIGLRGAFVATLAPLFVGQRLPLRICCPSSAGSVSRKLKTPVAERRW